MNLRSPDDPVGANADATFDLLKNDWALHIIECRGLKKGEGCTDFNGSFSHQLRPIAFALGNTENGAVYKMLYGLTCEFLLWLHDFQWTLHAICQDHSSSSANAAMETWTQSCSIMLASHQTKCSEE